MPRMVAPEPDSGAFQVHVRKPFSGTATSTIEVIGEPNRPAVVRWDQKTSSTSSNEKVGDVPSDDVNELMSLVQTLRGFPSNPNSDSYGFDTVVELNTSEIQWSNADEDSAADVVSEIAQEQKDDFKRIVDSIEALARQFAKKDSAV